jgi:AcrR family transcriptional regulator
VISKSTLISDPREKLIETAKELFASHGFEGVSMRLLARKAKANIAMVSYYFGSKENLLKEIYIRKAEDTFTHLSFIEKSDLDPWSKMERVIEFYVERISSDPAFHRMMNREVSLDQRNNVSAGWQDATMRNFSIIKKIVEDGIKKKVFRQVDIPMCMATLIGTLTKITLSQGLVWKMCGERQTGDNFFNEKHKQRIADHLKSLFKHHLLLS